MDLHESACVTCVPIVDVAAIAIATNYSCMSTVIISYDVIAIAAVYQ